MSKIIVYCLADISSSHHKVYSHRLSVKTTAEMSIFVIPDIGNDGCFRITRSTGRVNIKQFVVVTGFFWRVGCGRRCFVQNVVQVSTVVSGW